MKKNVFKVQSKVWRYPGMAGWHFFSVPKKESKEIKERFGAKQRGWGSLPVLVTIGKTSWNTSIFPDSKEGGYILPLKAIVRKKENLYEGDKVTVTLSVIP